MKHHNDASKYDMKFSQSITPNYKGEISRGEIEIMRSIYILADEVDDLNNTLKTLLNALKK